MAPSPQWHRYRRAEAISADTRRWTIIVVVLLGSLGVFGIERWLRKPDAPITGSAFVVDGDTLTIAGKRIRLVDIDAPELDQSCLDGQARDWACGRRASSQLRSVVRGLDLTCLPRSRDQYGRTLATCTLPDKTDVNAWMVQQGWAVSNSYGRVYDLQQSDAKAAKRGIWVGSFTSPRDWRQQHPRDDHNQ